MEMADPQADQISQHRRLRGKLA